MALGNFDQRSAYQIVEGIYTSVITNDITKRHHIMNYDLFNRVVKYIVENVGKTFSANAIAKFLKSEGRTLSVEVVYNYLNWLEKVFVIYRCQRYDLQGKSVLKTQEKFYLADPSLKYCIMGFNPKSIAAMLENVVYFELRRRGYEAYIGKNETKEIDFVAVRRDERIYVQVCRRLPEESDREVGSLLEIKDPLPQICGHAGRTGCRKYQRRENPAFGRFLVEQRLLMQFKWSGAANSADVMFLMQKMKNTK